MTKYPLLIILIQIAVDKFVNGITSKDLHRSLVSLELGHQATDEEVEKFMDGKTFVSEQVELSDGLPLYKGQKPAMMMSLGKFSMPWMGSGEEGVDNYENEGFSIISEFTRPTKVDDSLGANDPILDNEQGIEGIGKGLSTNLESGASGPEASARSPEDEQHILTEPRGFAPKFAYTSGAVEDSEHIRQPIFGLNYEPLQSDLREIRLLSLSPDSQNEENKLCLKLEKFPLDKAPRFTALSYAWGSPERSCTIRCNDQTLPITASLNNALVRVFRWNQRLYLWADGVCINQRDVAERSAQVKLMGEIYSRAMRTAAYLGEPDANDEALEGKAEHSAFALMNMLSRIWEHDQEHALRSEEDWNALQIPDRGNQQSRDVWIALLSVWVQPWFTRAWVLQEVVLAADIHVFYGDAVSNLECLMGFWQLAQNHDVPPPLKYGAIADAEALVRNSNQLGIFKRLRDFRKEAKDRIKKRKEDEALQSGQNGDEGRLVLSSAPKQESLRPLRLLELLVLSRANGATDSRDKVYSLLAMANDVKPGEIVPDYDASNTTAKVYKSVAELYISRGFGINLLHHAGLPQRIEGLPTWVPDWSHKSQFPFTTSLYCCTPAVIPRISFSNETSSITIRGAIIDSYSIPGMQCNFRSWDSTDYGRNDDDMLPDLPTIQSDEQMRRMLQMSPEMLMHILLEPLYHTGEDTDTALWRTLIANRGWKGGKPTDMDRSSYDAYVRSYPSSMSSDNAELRSEDPELRQQSWPFETVMQDVHRGRRFGITACGHVGVFPGETRNGDLIVLLPGATMPFVLRRSGGDGYILVGDCYLHGVMEGELIHAPEGQEEPLEAKYTEMDIEGKPFSLRMRPWARFTTDKTKDSLRGIIQPEGNGYAPFQDFNIH